MGGRDKLLEEVDGIPLLRRQVQIAQETGQPIYVALPPDAGARREVLKDSDATLLTVPDSREGMSGTMRGAVAQLPPVAAFMITLADLVELQTTDYCAVCDARDMHPDHVIWRGATVDGKPGHPILFDVSLRPAFATLTGDDGGGRLVKPLQGRTHLVTLPENRARFDLDTPQDWAAWRRSKP